MQSIADSCLEIQINSTYQILLKTFSSKIRVSLNITCHLSIISKNGHSAQSLDITRIG